MTDYREYSEEIHRLNFALGELTELARLHDVPLPDDARWLQLLRTKLLPQAQLSPHLVVAVVGGTNIGKSVVFNHLAGDHISAISPMAAGTKHPVCLVPEGSDEQQELETLFAGFDVVPWESADQPLMESDADRLFWLLGSKLPERLMLLDAPDIDSDAQVNWRRAEMIRDVSDVLLAVLTQQKYNDAAVVKYFTDAARADKPIIVVFNQCDIERHGEWWPQWLETFCDATGAQPESVYVVPYDPAATDDLKLPFYSVGDDGNGDVDLDRPSSLSDELATFRFDEIKLQTLRGAVSRVLDPEEGIDTYLDSVQAVSDRAQDNVKLFAELVKVDRWPDLPPDLLTSVIQDWWSEHLASWLRPVDGAYRMLGSGMRWTMRKAKRLVSGDVQVEQTPAEHYKEEERAKLLSMIDELVDALERRAKTTDDRFRERLEPMLGGDRRTKLRDTLIEEHAKVELIDDAFRQFVYDELDEYRRQDPKEFKRLKNRMHLMVGLKVTVTVTVGVLTAGMVPGPVDAIAGSVIAGGGAESGAGMAVRLLYKKMIEQFAARRAKWFAQLVEREYLGELISELKQAVTLPDSEPFKGVEESIERLRETFGIQEG